MEQIACGHCNKSRCRLCWLYRTDPRYRALWGGNPTEAKAAQRTHASSINKPRMSVEELSQKRRTCQELRRQGLPCTEFQQSPSPNQGVFTAHSIPAPPEGEGEMKIRWVYGITTVPIRRAKIFPRTLNSLRESGFDEPVLFVDGCTHQEAISYENEFQLPVVSRYPNIRTFGNWVLSLAELYIRNPAKDRYAIFQDDFVCSRGLRQYLDLCPYPDGTAKVGGRRGYWNLYLFDDNLRMFPKDQTVRRERQQGWHESNGQGLGAVALVFNRDAVIELLTEKGHITTRPAEPTDRAWSAVDGGIVDAMKKRGYKEYVHNPSLVQHIGIASTMSSNRHPSASTFRGEDFNLLTLVPK